MYRRNFASRLGRYYAKPLWLSLRSETKSHRDLGALIMLKIRPVITNFQIKLICSCCAPKQKLIFTSRSLFVRYENTSVLNGKGRIMNHDVRSNQRERERERDDRNERAWETQKIPFPRTFKHSYKIIRWYYTGYKWWERTCVENTSSFATVKRTEHVGWDRVHSRALSNEISIRFFLFSHDNEVEVKYFTERPYICNEYDERTFDMWSDSLKS